MVVVVYSCPAGERSGAEDSCGIHARRCSEAFRRELSSVRQPRFLPTRGGRLSWASRGAAALGALGRRASGAHLRNGRGSAANGRSERSENDVVNVQLRADAVLVAICRH